MHSADGSKPEAGDFAAGLLSTPQPNLTARPTINMVRTVGGPKPGDFIVDFSIEGLMPFGESSADLFYKGTQIDLLRFSRPGVGISPPNGTTFASSGEIVGD